EMSNEPCRVVTHQAAGASLQRLLVFRLGAAVAAGTLRCPIAQAACQPQPPPSPKIHAEVQQGQQGIMACLIEGRSVGAVIRRLEHLLGSRGLQPLLFDSIIAPGRSNEQRQALAGCQRVVQPAYGIGSHGLFCSFRKLRTVSSISTLAAKTPDSM